jgi:hypothetical protein
MFTFLGHAHLVFYQLTCNRKLTGTLDEIFDSWNNRWWDCNTNSHRPSAEPVQCPCYWPGGTEMWAKTGRPATKWKAGTMNLSFWHIDKTLLKLTVFNMWIGAQQTKNSTIITKSIRITCNYIDSHLIYTCNYQTAAKAFETYLFLGLNRLVHVIRTDGVSWKFVCWIFSLYLLFVFVVTSRSVVRSIHITAVRDTRRVRRQMGIWTYRRL